MSRSSSARGAALTVSIAVWALVPLAGCRNPFSPSADVELIRMSGNRGYNEIQVEQETTLNEGHFQGWRAFALFIVRNRVGVNIRSVNIVYTNMAGEEVTPYRTSGGKSYKLSARLEPVPDQQAPTNYGATGTYGMERTLDVYVVDRKVYETLENMPGTNLVIIAHVTFFGEDDNGYDVKLSSSISIKGNDF